MNSLTRISVKSKLPSLIYSVRSAGTWYKDLMPGPYPTTPEQKAAAAKKYNLLPEEYEADPDGFGDYPKLPMISTESKDPFRDWDFPEHRKDFGEPMHTMANLIGEDRWDCNHVEKQQIHPSIQVCMYIGVMLGFFLPYWWFEDKKISLPHMKKHYPADGVHYKYS